MRELEAKLSVAEDFELPDLEGPLAASGAEVSAATDRTIADTYYDTADLRLLRWGCTLRHRKRRGWVVKLPIAATEHDLARHEIQLGGRAGNPPPEARRLVAPFARSEPLVEVATITTHRTVRPIRDPEGRSLVEVADDRVSGETADGRVTTFRQVEVELAPEADPEILRPIVAALIEAGAEPQPGGIKLAIALGHPSLEPDVPVPALPGRPSARQVIQRAIASSVAQLLEQLPVARLGHDPEGIHQARVATRRLRSDLRTFGPLLDADRVEAIRPGLAELGARLGEVRDADVLAGLLRATAETAPRIDPDGVDEILAVLGSQRQQALLALDAHLDDPTTVQLLDDLVGAAADPPTAPAAADPAKERMPGLVTRRWRRVDRAFGALGADPPASALHEARILTKRARYATEAVAPSFGAKTRRFARSLAAVQDTLGDLNDASIASRWLLANGPTLASSGAFAAGQLAEHFGSVTADDRWQPTWAEAHRRRPGWLEAAQGTRRSRKGRSSAGR